MNENLIKIAALLSDCRYHDGTSIGNQLNVTRAAVWKAIKKLEDYGIPLKSVKGKGYLLENPLILLEEEKIKSHLSSHAIDLTILEKVDSTNEYLKKQINHDNKIKVCAAEVQTQGKARFNRQWHSPFGRNLYLSLLYPFQKDVSELSGLSLVVSLAACKAIETICKLNEPLSIKWPNDIVANQKKVAGSLIEIQAESNGFCSAVIGVGTNVNMQQATKKQINQQWVSLQKLSGQYHDRNALCASMINYMLDYLERFRNAGLIDFMKEWKIRDYLYNKAIKLSSNKILYSGMGGGINPQGHLILKLPDNVKKTFSSGDATLLK